MVAIPWKFESSYAHQKKFWGCSSVDRALRSHRRGRGFESHQLHHEFSLSRTKCARLRKFSAARSLGEVWHKAKKSWGYGGMVDAEDLKSFDHCDRVGSSPTIPTKNLISASADFFLEVFGCVAQLVRALRSHRRGRWFESNHIHQNKNRESPCFFYLLLSVLP